jgi:WD40 repeat protein
MRPALSALVLTLYVFAVVVTAQGQESGAAASPGRMAAEAIPADTAIVIVQAPKGTKVYSDTHKQDYGETTRFAFSGLKRGETFQTKFTVTFPSKKKATRLFYLAGGQQFTLVFQETQEARPTLALQRGHGRNNSYVLDVMEPSIHARYSSDGQYLLSWSKDRGDIRLWDASNGRLLRVFQIPIPKSAIVPRELVHCRVDTPTGEVVADASYLGIERYRWNYKTGVSISDREIARRSPGEIVDYAPSSGHAIFRTDDMGVWLYETKNGKPIIKLGNWVNPAPGSGPPPPEPEYYFAGRQSQYACKLDFKASILTLYATTNGRLIRTIRLPKRTSNRVEITAARFSQWKVDTAGAGLFIVGSLFASLADNETDPVCLIVDHDKGDITTVSKSQVEGIGGEHALQIEKLWMSAQTHVESGKLAVGRHLLTWPELRPVISFDAPDAYSPHAFSDDGSRVVYHSGDSLGGVPQFLVYDTATGRRVCEMAGGSDGVSGIVVPPSGNELWVANDARTWLQKFELSTAQPAAPIIARRPGFLEGLMLDPAAAVSLPGFSANNEVVWFADVFDRQSGKGLFSFHEMLTRSDNRDRPGGWFSGWFRSSQKSVVSHDGRVVAFSTTRFDNRESAQNGFSGMTLWDTTKRELLREVKPGRPIFFSPNDKTLLYSTTDTESIELLRVADGATISRREGPILDIMSSPFSRFSQDGKKIAMAGTAIRMPNGNYVFSDRDLEEWMEREGRVAALSTLSDTLRPRVEIWDGTLRNKLRTIETKKSVLCVAFSPDSRLLAYAAGNEIVVLSEQGYVMRTFSTHSGSVGSLVWNSDSRRLLSSSTDGTIGLWDVGTGDELARLIPLDPRVPPGAIDFDDLDKRGAPAEMAPLAPLAPQARLDRPGRPSSEPSIQFTSAFQPPPQPAPSEDTPPAPDGGGNAGLADIAERDWLVVTPEGLFDGSLGGRQRVGFRVGDGLNVVPVDRFFQDFYYPGLWDELWRGERPMPTAKFGGSQPPKVTLVTRFKSEKVETQTVGIVADVTDQGGGYRTPWLRHNGVVIAATLAPETRPNGIRQTFEVTLVEGVNKLEIISASADGSWESEPASLTVLFEASVKKPALHVVAVGINQYGGGLKLNYAAKDAKALAELFEVRGQQLFSDVHVRVLSDAKASYKSILEALAGIKAAPQDVFVLFLAGHGVTIGQRYYFLPSDFRDDPGTPLDDDVRKSGVPNDELIDRVNKVAALKRIVIYDTCQSGAALGIPGARGVGTAKAMEAFSRAGSWLIAASAGNENAHELAELEHGILTYALLAGAAAIKHGPLAERHHDEQPLITVRGWFGYAQDMVPTLGKDYFGQEQAIEFRASKGNFPVLPARKPSMP